MTIEVRVPALGESVSEATVVTWRKAPGEAVAMDEALVELETDKATLEVYAPVAGALTEIMAPAGSDVAVGALLCAIAEGAVGRAASIPAEADPAAVTADLPAKATAAPVDARPPAAAIPPGSPQPHHAVGPLSPAVRKLIEEHDLDPARITPSGPGGRLTKADVRSAVEAGTATREQEPRPLVASAAAARQERAGEERVRMSRLRQAIARRLKEAQNTAAMLTTYNEADMGAVMALRAEYRDAFEARHGVRLGFMSFFVKACITALRESPAVNGEIDGDEIIYKNYYDIGVAVGTGQGLVVPVLRGADALSLAGIEKTINDFSQRARDGKLGPDEMSGGTFTISNGGVYGSLMSSPILNPPQSGILGMHRIQQRPMAVDGKVEIRPMMYLALSYDHRIIDGREAVTFLVRVKETIEDPRRLLLEL